MTTITKERLLTIKQWRETYGPGSNVVLPAEEAEELARIALASLEAEPVAYIFKHPAGKLFWALTDESNKDQSDVIPVYAAPPVPVVPAALPENDDEDGHDIDYLDPSEVYALGRTAGWNACRAAMLQAGNFRENKDSSTNNFRETSETSTNSPVIPDGLSTVCAEAYQVVGVMADALGVFGDAAVQKVLDNLSQQKLVHRDVLPFSLPVTPDGWISCSERMPEETGDIIVVSDGIVMSGISYSRRDGFYIAALEYDDDEPIGGVTHWMPLPEPPQGVNDELA
ncbi:TPA: DUF551 domain-containing protein [Escherichia coli]|nr:DUF551 domain-containing protein [Escherichia coli]EHO0036183.1 DUF551 domain-containing protein [Escherichia coli]EHQ7200651.1 DUF551 domain-containing protein [Escherichia coli]EHW5711940.1 DUF551 domain-containing protein [Escherichia coli]EII7585405.1 DUF551 domain-containing protein [Escherichia coli]